MIGKEEEGKALLHEFTLKQIIHCLKYQKVESDEINQFAK